MRHVHRWCAFAICLLTLAACDASGNGGGESVTPTPAQAVPVAPVLGGTEGAFEAKYGSPSRATLGNLEFATQSKWGLLVVSIQTDAQIGELKSSNDRVYAVNVGIADGNPTQWTLADAMAACVPFLPPDAVHEHDVAPVVGIGIVKLYRSALLANTFPASYFEDSHQQPMQPGELEAGYQFFTSDGGGTYDNLHYSSCSVAAGIPDAM